MARLSGLTAVCGLEAEAKLLRPLGVAVLVTGGDAARGKVAAERAASGRAGGLLSFGICGGLAPGLASGSLLLPRAVKSESGETFATDEALRAGLAGAFKSAGLALTEGEFLGLDRMAMTRGDKAALFARFGASAVDTESLFVARAAKRAGIPFIVLRAVSDPDDVTLPPATSVGLDANGNPAILPVLLSLLKDPAQLPGLIRAARDANRALASLRAATAALISK